MRKEYDFKIVFDKLGEAVKNQEKAGDSDTHELTQHVSEIQALQKIIAEITEASEESGTYTRAS